MSPMNAILSKYSIFRLSRYLSINFSESPFPYEYI